MNLLHQHQWHCTAVQQVFQVFYILPHLPSILAIEKIKIPQGNRSCSLEDIFIFGQPG
jgi:hypothetical protein